MVRYLKCEAKNGISVADNREPLKAVSRWGATFDVHMPDGGRERGKD